METGKATGHAQPSGAQRRASGGEAETNLNHLLPYYSYYYLFY
jgi:hypothetical protein